MHHFQRVVQEKKTQSESLLLEQRLNNLYRQAYRETLSDSDAFWKKYETQIADKYQQYKDGKITQQDYWSWVNGHKKMGKRIDNLSANIADRMVNTGNIASSYINNTTPKIFAESANYEAYTIEKELGFSMQKSFSLIDDDALKALIEGNSTEFKAKWKNTFTDPPKIYSWTYSKVQDSIHTGILKGESVPKIASRIQQVTESDRATAIRNARTSITSAYNQGQMATFERAAKMGIEVKKEWIATNDIRTRDSHAQLNGIRVGWDDKFPNGLKCPADPSGRPEEVYNCRCSMARVPFDEPAIQSIVWDDEEQTYKKQVDTDQTYNEWKNKKQKSNEEQHVYSEKINAFCSKLDAENVKYNQVEKLSDTRTSSEIIKAISGGDLTKGSCASVALAYAGQKCGYDVLDFRGGDSRDFFSSKKNKIDMFKSLGVNSSRYDTFNTNLANGKLALKDMEQGKEYYLSVGKHAAIVRLSGNGVMQYLELQKKSMNGWVSFTDANDVLERRFGCKRTARVNYAMLTDIDQLQGNNDFEKVLGYINTAKGDQRKGIKGYAK